MNCVLVRWCEAIVGAGSGMHCRVLRRMRVMAVNAVVSPPRPFGQIPVTRHAAVCSVLITPKLRSVALSTQVHRVCVLDGTPIGQVQSCEPVFGVMAGDTGQLPVIEYQTLMKLVEMAGRGIVHIRRSHIVTTSAGQPNRVSLVVESTRFNARRRLGDSDHDGIQR